MKAFLWPAARTLLRAAVVASTTLSCYSGGGSGRPPPAKTFYFPTGLAVSPDGNVLYAANSDFDLQWNGGTLQSYDLQQLRQDAALLIQVNLSGPNASRPDIPFIDPTLWHPNCQLSPPSGGMFLGEACSPPVDSGHYFRHSVNIGAFAADVQVSLGGFASGTPGRLYAPVGGDESLTWADVGLGADRDNPGDEFAIVCGQDSVGRCDAKHRVGNDPNQAGDTRQLTMPDGPFGIAQTPDGKAIALTHQTAPAISLATTGFEASPPELPALKFVLAAQDAGIPAPPIGGSGIAAVPHDPDGPEKPCEPPANTPPCLRPAFLETFHSTPEIDLLRYYDDDGTPLHQPFIQREGIFPLTANAMGTDSREIVIDPTPSIACKAQGLDPTMCALQNPPRVFFASRTPTALTVGHIGDFDISDGTYNPDQLVITRNVPLPPGPSKVYLAPIVNQAGAFELRVFVVLFDSSQIAVFNPSVPDDSAVTLIDVGPGPAAMAFDAFTFEDVGRQAMAASATTPYRFAYVASFTQSYVQMIDLDNSRPTAETFERVVFTLGSPTLPIGQQSQQHSPGFL